MEKTIGVTIHNRFDFEVTDVNTGELKQTATAYNIILNKMWWSLCNSRIFFSNINVGQGTGTLDPARTALFSQLGSYSATVVSQVMALPTSYNKKKIVLAPETLIGKVISEVGITNDLGELVTHAMLQDSEGNPITITKTSTDIVTIYATVFSNVAETEELKLIAMPANNALLRYLSGISSSPENIIIRLGSSNAPTSRYLLGTASKELGSFACTINSTRDEALKKFTSQVSRCSVDVGNGNIQEIAFCPYVRMVLPNAVCPSKTYTGVTVGSGDGATSSFVLPSSNIDLSTLKVYANGVEVTDCTASNPLTVNFNYDFASSNMSGGSGISLRKSISSDLWLAISGGVLYWGPAAGGYLRYLSYSTTIITQNGGFGARFLDISPVEPLAACPNTGTDKVRFLDLSTSTPVVSTISLDVQPTQEVMCVAFSSDGQHLAVGCLGLPVYIYKRNGNSYQKLTDIAGSLVFANSSLNGGYLRYFGDLLVVRTSHTTPYLETLKRTGDTYALHLSPVAAAAAQDPTTTYSMCTNDAGTKLYLASNVANGVLKTFDISTDGSLTAATDLTLTGAGTIGTIENVGNDIYLITTSGGTSVKLYAIVGTVATLTSSHTCTNSVSFNAFGGMTKISDTAYAARIWSGGGFAIGAIDVAERSTKVAFSTPPASGVALTATYAVNGIHKTNQYVIDFQISVQFGEGV